MVISKNNKFLSVFLFSVLSLFYACGNTDCGGGDYIGKEHERFHSSIYRLVNGTDDFIYTEIYYPKNGGTITITTAIRPNDSISLYQVRIRIVGDKVMDTVTSNFHANNHYSFNEITMYFDSTANLIIRDSKGSVLFYGTEATAKCGTENFVFIRCDFNCDNDRGSRDYIYHWTIDSAYIADMACDMSLEDLESEVLQNE